MEAVWFNRVVLNACEGLESSRRFRNWLLLLKGFSCRVGGPSITLVKFLSIDAPTNYGT